MTKSLDRVPYEATCLFPLVPQYLGQCPVHSRSLTDSLIKDGPLIIFWILLVETYYIFY